MKPLVTKIWGQRIENYSLDISNFEGTLVDCVKADRQAKIISIYLKGSKPISGSALQQLAAALVYEFPGYIQVQTSSFFDYEQLTPETVLELAEELKKKDLPINGFLNHAQVSIDGNVISIDVCNGDNILRQIKFEEKLAILVQKHTGVLPQVQLKCTNRPVGYESKPVTVTAAPRPIVKMQKPVTRSAKSAKEEKADFSIPGLQLDDTPLKVVMGKGFKPGEVLPLREIGSEAGKCVVWGDVFACEISGNRRKVCTISLTDYTGSVSLKIISGFDENVEKWI
ncbi:MAG: PolC-type DNA polymerase III, partial [Oscillospiraceae bacterium]|nr:PolC-type DNA polymerase III [Oscillospiraceae bacterium]